MRILRVLLLLALTANLLQAQPAQEIIKKIPFRSIGPAYMTGRIADIEKDPQNSSTWYVAVASGNVWKTQNNGSTWTPIFDQYGSFSTGCLAIDPVKPQVVWLGTGENQSQRSVSWGDGVYKSLDGGKSWKNMGLSRSEHIGKILIDPRNTDVVYVAAQGPLWAAGGERGVYKTVDGGQNWEQVLAISENTGVADLTFDPQNPDIIYAASYQRRRHVGILVAGGEESRIYKSSDGGLSWKKLSRGLPGGELGRIAVAVSPQKSNVVYAMIAGSNDRQSGFYRSEDYGESWTKKNDYVIVDPQYYGEIFADPHQFDKVYVVDVIIRYTENGGADFKRLNTRFKHVDNHEIVFDPLDPDYLMVGCDGGVYESWDRGDHWTYHSNLPITQFYRVGLDNDFPFYNIYGGTQDNSTLYGPSRTTSRHGITNADWKLALGGDGFQARIDPEDPNIVYCESQYAGIVRYDKRTGTRIDIQPQPAPNEEALRWHWDAPLLISPHNSKRLYFAAQKVFRSDNRGDSWSALGGDLSRGEDRNQRMVMGKRWSPEAVWKNVFTSPYGTIVSMVESPIQEGLLIVGTDDGLIQISADAGENWATVDDIPGVPTKAYVADVFASNHDVNLLYAVFNNHKEGDFKAYVAKSTNRGKNWTLITNGLDAPHACWSIVEDHKDPNLLFLATEYGMFCSVNAGESWTQMKNGLPTIAFRDIEIQKREDDLVAASFGRGMYVLDNYNALRKTELEALPQDEFFGHLFSVKPAWQYFERGDMGYSLKGSFGDNFYTAANPPYGAVLDIYLSESLQTAKAKRKAAEKGKTDAALPSAAALRSEDFEQAPQVWVQIKDASGQAMKRIKVSNKKGYQRLVWNLSAELKSQDQKRTLTIQHLAPGTYTAQLFSAQNGQLRTLSAPAPVEIKTLDLTPEEPLTDRIATQRRIINALFAVDELAAQINKAIEKVEKEQSQAFEQGQSAEELEQKRLELLNLQYEVTGDQSKRKRFEYFLPGLRDRIRRVYRVQFQSFQLTQTHLDNLALVEKKTKALEERLQKILDE